MIHYHGCPSCYEKFPCNMDCSIAYEDEDDGRLYGSYYECDDCKRETPPTDQEEFIRWYKEESQKLKPNRAWWRIYNGYRK